MTNITLNISDDNKQKLQEESNQSALVNSLLTEHFDGENMGNSEFLARKIAENKEIIKKIRKENRFLDGKMKKIKEKEKQILKKVLKKDLEKVRKDPILDPILWKQKGWDKKFPDQWKKHLEFERGYN